MATTRKKKERQVKPLPFEQYITELALSVGGDQEKLKRKMKREIDRIKKEKKKNE